MRKFQINRFVSEFAKFGAAIGVAVGFNLLSKYFHFTFLEGLLGIVTLIGVYLLLSKLEYAMADSTVNRLTQKTLLQRRIIVLSGSLDRIKSLTLWIKLHYLNLKGNSAIYLLIDSEGGEARATRLFINGIVASKAPVVGIVAGIAYSAAAIILQCCDRRLAFPYSLLLIHDPSATIEFSVDNADAHMLRTGLKQVVNSIRTYNRNSICFRDIVCNRSHLTPEKFAALSNRELSAQEAKQYGLIDEIVTDLEQ